MVRLRGPIIVSAAMPLFAAMRRTIERQAVRLTSYWANGRIAAERQMGCRAALIVIAYGYARRKVRVAIGFRSLHQRKGAA